MIAASEQIAHRSGTVTAPAVGYQPFPMLREIQIRTKITRETNAIFGWIHRMNGVFLAQYNLPRLTGC
jgi:hypothetical protein